MATYTPLRSPTEARKHLQEVVSDWTQPIQRKLNRSAAINRRHKVATPTAYTEHVLTADIVFYVSDEGSNDPLEIIVPACAELTLFIQPNKWWPAKVIKDREERLQEAQRKGRRAFRATDADRRRVCFFKYTVEQRDWFVTIFDDGTIQQRSYAVRRPTG